jgi:hippurate hydrolase
MTSLLDGLDDLLPELHETYRDLHANPELGGQEHRTAAVAAAGLRERGYEVTENVGRTGVVGVLRNGDGPVVLLRADMDGLPMREDTGLPHASTNGVMHACGHDVHITCALGAADLLARHRDAWSGTLLIVLQPAEEIAAGARWMLDDGFLDRFPRPDVCLGQHVGPMPAGVVTVRPGTMMAAADTFTVRLFGKAGHGSTPERTIDPIVMAASVVLRLQAVVSREVGAHEQAVVTVGSLHAGEAANVIPDEAELKVNLRSFDPHVRQRVLDAVRRVVLAEARASGAEREPEIVPLNAFPLTVNDAAATERVVTALREHGRALRPMRHPLAGSEDFGLFGTEAGCPSVYWFVGCADHALFSQEDLERLDDGVLPAGVASNHNTRFAPVLDPTIRDGVINLVAAAAEWLRRP